MPSLSPHNVAVRPKGDVVVSIVDMPPSFQNRAHAYVFDLESRTKLGDFPVRYEAMGGVRHDLSRDDSVCFVGCYEAHGLAAYSIPDGKEIWRRKDLKTVQQVSASPCQPWVFCGRETGASHLVDSASGENIEKLTGVKQMFCSPEDQSVVVVGKKVELHRPFGNRVAVLSANPDWIFDCAFSKQQLVFRTASAVVCFSMSDGSLLWAVQEPRAANLNGDQLCYSAAKESFDWLEMFDGRMERIRSLDTASGTVSQTRNLAGPISRGTFCKGGEFLFGAMLQLRSAETGDLVHDFCTDDILKKDRNFKPKAVAAPVSEERVRELENLIVRLEQASQVSAEEGSSISRQPVPRSN